MEESSKDRSKISPILVNAAMALVIVCAVAFIALWAVPRFTQTSAANRASAKAQTSAIEWAKESQKATWGLTLDSPRVVSRADWEAYTKRAESESNHPIVNNSPAAVPSTDDPLNGPFFVAGTMGGTPQVVPVWRTSPDAGWQ